MKEFIGYIAGAFTTISFLPQLIKVVKTKSTKDISLMMFVIVSIGIILWLVYGILINALPIIAANTVSIILAGAILVYKLKYK